MCDFEKSILNACETIFQDASISCCFFHLGQSIYQKIQDSWLQKCNCDSDDDIIHIQNHMLLTLAFVPVEDLSRIFDLLESKVDEDLLPVFEYFEEYYVTGRAWRGRRRAVPPWYPLVVWNQHTAALEVDHKTNNISEGWHNQFMILVGKHYADLYSLMNEIQKEQADSEIMVTEISSGRRVKAVPK